ncbi:proteoglycan 4b isoform X2 [Phyllopteryx taeniolatus]|uniref:proteoglycan 4b isoform X2 n=1 Tax=Phyllopteryx taeniolatus TaxID=161469 RepID=UPI002AD52864|nr:proteoglycan 4b isoform X2 [Phyllopteryx taeniolatus]
MSLTLLRSLILLACALTPIVSQTSCRGRCGNEYYRGYLCQCDYNCMPYGECCHDFESQCTTKNSCRGRCGESFKRGQPCSCDSDCVKFKQCCPDYKIHCDPEEENNGASSATAPGTSSSCDNVDAKNPKEEQPPLALSGENDEDMYTETMPSDDQSYTEVPEESQTPDSTSVYGSSPAEPLDLVSTQAALITDTSQASTEAGTLATTASEDKVKLTTIDMADGVTTTADSSDATTLPDSGTASPQATTAAEKVSNQPTLTSEHQPEPSPTTDTTREEITSQAQTGAPTEAASEKTEGAPSFSPTAPNVAASSEPSQEQSTTSAPQEPSQESSTSSVPPLEPSQESSTPSVPPEPSQESSTTSTPQEPFEGLSTTSVPQEPSQESSTTSAPLESTQESSTDAENSEAPMIPDLTTVVSPSIPTTLVVTTHLDSSPSDPENPSTSVSPVGSDLDVITTVNPWPIDVSQVDSSNEVTPAKPSSDPQTVTQIPTSPQSSEPTPKPQDKPNPSSLLTTTAPVDKPALKPGTKPVDAVQTVDSSRDYQADDSNDTNLCSGRPASAVTTLKNGTIAVFRGHYFWFLDINRVPGPARDITQGWGVPSPIDTAFTRCNCQGKTYILKGNQYWRFENNNLDPGYPKVVETGFDGLRGHITAALSVPRYRGRRETVYFFKRGGLVQKYSYKFGTGPSCNKKPHYAIYTVRNRVVRHAVSLLGPTINIRTAWRGFPTTITSAVSVPSSREPEGYKYYVFSRSKSYNIRMDGEQPAVTPPRENPSAQNNNFINCPQTL